MDKKTNKDPYEVIKENNQVEPFSHKVIRIFFGGSFICNLLVNIYGLIIGSLSPSKIPKIIVQGSILFCIFSLTIPRFEKHKLWILIWGTIFCFLSIFTYG